MNIDLAPLRECLEKANSQLDIDECNKLYRGTISLFEKLPTDVLLYLLLLLDSKTIAGLCKISFKLNKLICNETPGSNKLWKNIIRRKYGNKFGDYSKERNVYSSFRQQLNEEYTDTGNYYPDRGLEIAAETGDMHLVKFFIKKGTDNWRGGINAAAQGGHLDIVKLLIEKGSQYSKENFYRDWGTNYAARGGHLDIVKFFLEKNRGNFAGGLIEGMNWAAWGGHLDVVKFFIKEGVNDWNTGMYYAARGGHLDLVKFFIKEGADDWNKGMVWAAWGGYLNIIKFFVKMGADEWDKSIRRALEEDTDGVHLVYDVLPPKNYPEVIKYLGKKI